MFITKLSIQHYKTIEDPITINDFSNAHILIGPNNAGKTNVLDAIELFLSPNLDPDRFFDESARLSLTIQHDGVELDIHFADHARTYVLNGNVVTGEDTYVQRAQERMVRITHDTLLEEVVSEKVKEFNDMYPDVYDDFVSTLQTYFDDIEISEHLFMQSVHADRKERPLVRMGDGFRRLFVMLFYIFHPNYDIILIDEPELHLHPSVLRKLLRVIADKRFENQVFLSTHSSAFVVPRMIERIWRVARDENRNTKIHFLKEGYWGLTKERLVQEIDADNAEMFFAEKVLLVEGVSDRILMRGLIDKFYHGRHDIKVVYTGSKGNVDVYSGLCSAFHIPYVVMLDRDAVSGTWSRLLTHSLKGAHRAGFKKQIDVLKNKHIFILEGNLEDSYPKKYQKHGDSKPLNALHAAAQITAEDLKTVQMKVVAEVLKCL